MSALTAGGGGLVIEIGIFNDEGCVEAQFYSVAEAQAAVADRYSDEDHLVIEEVCPEHEEQAAASCEECFTEDEDEEEWTA
jgi:hypothetical protein